MDDTSNSQVDENHQASNTEQQANMEVDDSAVMEEVQYISSVKGGIRKFSKTEEKMDANENHINLSVEGQQHDVSSPMKSPSKQKTSQSAQEPKSPQEIVGINKRKDQRIAIQTIDYQGKQGEWHNVYYYFRYQIIPCNRCSRSKPTRRRCWI